MIEEIKRGKIFYIEKMGWQVVLGLCSEVNNLDDIAESVALIVAYHDSRSP